MMPRYWFALAWYLMLCVPLVMTATGTSLPPSWTVHGSGPTINVQFFAFGGGPVGVGYLLGPGAVCATLAWAAGVGFAASWLMSHPVAPTTRTTRRIQVRAPFAMGSSSSFKSRPPWAARR